MLSQELPDFLQSKGVQLKHDLGQNFLINNEVLENIVKAGNIQPEDHIVEIGPGVGVLTRELVQKANEVTAIELDEQLIPLLREFVKPTGKLSRLHVINGNALQQVMPSKPYKIIANIPYHITSPLLRLAFLESPQIPTSMTLLIQKEVALKICDTKHAGILTILVALFGKPKIVCNVPPESFIPPPKVDSAVLHIESFSEPLVDNKSIEKIFKLTKQAFAQKRKMLRNTIGGTPEGAELLIKANIEPTRRPETLSIEEWITLARSMAQ